MDNVDDSILNEHKTPPTTVREVGIHLIYMSKSMGEMAKKLDEMGGKFAHRQELLDAIMQRKADQQVICKDVTEVADRVSALEKYNDTIKTTIAKWAIVALVLMVLTVYGMEKLFK